MDWFLYDRDLRHERVNSNLYNLASMQCLLETFPYMILENVTIYIYGDVARKEGSGRPQPVRTEENTKLVEEMVLNQEDQPEAHSTPAEIVHDLNIDG